MNGKKYDKILGCWLGKCIGGNIGAPYEGMKQRMCVPFERDVAKKEIPNDDLDLQILWLDLLEKEGKDITCEDLADSFYENCPYAPGEYAFFKKNYQKNIMPPLSGNFNNSFFWNGMGSPIRSEIWACLFPEDIPTAIKYAKMDSMLDHQTKGDSYWGEVFLTALECLCFTYEEPYDLVERALSYIPKKCALRLAIEDVMAWCKKERDMEIIQTSILRRHGHSESCMAKENISILIAAFLLHGADFEKGIMEAIRCGFDADCTGATLGSILGILLGGERLKELFEIEDMKYKLGVKSARTDLTVSKLAKDVYELSEKFKTDDTPKRKIHTEQLGSPSIRMGHSKTIEIKLTPPYPMGEVTFEAKGSEYLEILTPKIRTQLDGMTKLKVRVKLKASKLYPEGAGGELWLNGNRVGRFGVSVNRKWRVYGPYWKNEVVIPQLTDGLTYGKFIPRTNRDDLMDHMRLFHLSCLPDEDAVTSPKQLRGQVHEIAESQEDIVYLNECTGFHGNAVYFFETVVYSEKERTTGIQIGRNVPIKVWLNGELIAEKDGNETFYYEVRHRLAVKLKQGKNKLTFKVIKNSDDGRFSYQFLTNGVCSDHLPLQMVNIK